MSKGTVQIDIEAYDNLKEIERLYDSKTITVVDRGWGGTYERQLLGTESRILKSQYEKIVRLELEKLELKTKMALEKKCNCKKKPWYQKIFKR